MLYFGSFNPVHRGHIALAEYVVGQGLCDEAVLVVSPQSPYKQAAELAPEMDRFEMAEIACAASKYPERIKPSVVEFLLPKPSYTIDTLRYLKENHGAEMGFPILMSLPTSSNLSTVGRSTKNTRIPGLRLPAAAKPVGAFRRGRITAADGRPVAGFRLDGRARTHPGGGEGRLAPCSTRRRRLPLRRKGLWSPATRIAAHGAQIAAEPGKRRSGRGTETPLPDGRSGVRPSTTSTRRCVSTTATPKPGVCQMVRNTGIPIQKRYIQPPEMTRLKISPPGRRRFARTGNRPSERRPDRGGPRPLEIRHHGHRPHGRDWHHTCPRRAAVAGGQE